MGPLVDPLAYEFFVRALIAAVIVGMVCAVVGTFVVLRGIAFIGDAVAHASFPGVVAAYLLSIPFYLGGTSLLIVVNVTMDTVTQIQSHLIAHQYGDLIKKAKLKGGRGR